MITINQSEVLDKIKNEILKSYPILYPRKNNEIKSIMEIYFTFTITNDNTPVTTIGFLDGNEYSRVSTPITYKLDEYIDYEIVNQLISYLIINYPSISGFSIFPLSFSLNFEYPFEMENKEGISCNKIILKFNVRDKELIPILNQYLTNILVSFTKELSQTQTFQYKYNEYCNNLQRSILDSLTEEEIEEMIKMFPIEMKRELMKKIPNQYFLKFYYEHSHQNDSQSKQLIKNEIKKLK